MEFVWFEETKEQRNTITSLSPDFFYGRKKLLDFKRERERESLWCVVFFFYFLFFFINYYDIFQVRTGWVTRVSECASVLLIVVTAFTGEWFMPDETLWDDEIKQKFLRLCVHLSFITFQTKSSMISSSLVFSSFFPFFFYIFLFFHKYFWIILFYTFPGIAQIKLNTDGLFIKIKINIKKAALWVSWLDGLSVSLGIYPVQ